MRKCSTAWILLSFFFLSLGFSGRLTGEESKAKDEPKQIRNWTVLPILFYTPETGIAGGAGGLLSVRTKGAPPEKRPTSYGALAVITQKKQFQLSFAPNIYLENESFHLFGFIDLFKFVDRFYCIGARTDLAAEEIYSSRFVHLVSDLHKRIRTNLYAGLRYEFLNNRLTEIEPSGQLAGADFPGTEPHTVSGLGFSLNWDSRDNIFGPRRGSFHQLNVTFFSSAWGSDYRFLKSVIDLRTYLSPSRDHVLALQGFFSGISGTAPFEMLSLLGGQYMMRGYWLGRYRDKNMLIVQTEYRVKLWKRWGLAGFAGFGDVAESLGGFSLANFKSSVGFGLRFLLNREENLSLRLDLGFGKDSSGVYFTVLEAF